VIIVVVVVVLLYIMLAVFHTTATMLSCTCHLEVGQGRLNQRAHWVRAQGPRIFFLFEVPPTGCGEINLFKLIILLPSQRSL